MSLTSDEARLHATMQVSATMGKRAISITMMLFTMAGLSADIADYVPSPTQTSSLSCATAKSPSKGRMKSCSRLTVACISACGRRS